MRKNPFKHKNIPKNKKKFEHKSLAECQKSKNTNISVLNAFEHKNFNVPAAPSAPGTAVPHILSTVYSKPIVLKKGFSKPLKLQKCT